MNIPPVIERFLLGKSSDDSRCEDAVVVTPGFVAVIDGATYKGPATPATHATSPGKLVAHVIETALTTLHPRSTARQAIDSVSQEVQTSLRELDPATNRQAAAALVVLSAHRREVWRVGDCLFRVNDREYPAPPSIDDHIAAVRACYNMALLLGGESVDQLREHDKGRELVLPLLESKYRFRNSEAPSPFAFGAIDGSRVPDRFLEVVELPTTTCELAMSTDGYPRVLASLAQSEAYLHELLHDDPLCIGRFMSTKGVRIGDLSFDDRAYIRLRV